MEMENNYTEQLQENPAEEVEINPTETNEEFVAAEPVVEEKPQKKSISVKMMAILGGAAAALIALIIILASVLSNTYKTPLNLLMDYRNEKNPSKVLVREYQQLNGLCEKEYKSVLKIMQKSDDYDKDEVKDSYEEAIDERKDEYGKNYKYSYKIEEKEKLEKEDLKEVKTQIKDCAKQLKDILDELDDYDSDDWSDLADEMGLTKAQTKKLAGILEDVYKDLKSVKVTKGYKLDVTITLKGSELDEPEESDGTFYVYKINGRWVSTMAILRLRVLVSVFD